MSIIVEHEKRRKEILEKSIDVFMDEGFENVTYQKIADRCGITRTTLYLYFKNKKEIFNYSIKHLLGEVESDIHRVRKSHEFNCAEKLLNVIWMIIDRLEENRRLLSAILNYLIYISKNGMDPYYRIRKRTIRLRHILATMVIEGIRNGDLLPVSVRIADDMLYGMIEASIFRLVVLQCPTVGELRQAVALAIRKLQAPDKSHSNMGLS